MKKSALPNCIQTDDCVNIHGISVESHENIQYPAHRHAFYEFDYLISGESEVSLNGITHKLSGGNMVFLSPVDVHSYKSLNNTFASFISIHFTDLNLPEKLSLANHPASVISCNEELKAALFLLKKEFDDDLNEYTYPLLKNLLERMVILFLRHTKSIQERPIPREISYAISYISNHFRSPISLEKISKLCGYSEAYFCRQFKEYLGIGFNEYLNKMRLYYAKVLLLSQKISVTDLCYECGFNSPRNFSRAFTAQYGCSPSEYAKQSKFVL